jgi:hypothetical protein
MFDDLRAQANTSPFLEEEEAPELEPEPKPSGRFLGMTPAQRFIVALLLLLVTCVSSALLLVVMGKVVLPFG